MILVALLIALIAAAVVFYVLRWLGAPDVVAGLIAALVFVVVFFSGDTSGVR